jgi:hypothetical protein
MHITFGGEISRKEALRRPTYRWKDKLYFRKFVRMK